MNHMTINETKLELKYTQECQKLRRRIFGIKKVEEGVKLILDGLKDEFGIDPHDENFKDTPARVSRAYAEIFSGMVDTEVQVKHILGTAYSSQLDEMVLVGPINVFSFCPHHLLTVEMIVHVAYVPQGKVLGLSKLARLTQVLAARPLLQEQLTEDITSALMGDQHTKNFQSGPGLLAKGAACTVRGRHMCMATRGAKADAAWTTTSSMKGVFLSEAEARAEFFSLVKS